MVSSPHPPIGRTKAECGSAPDPDDHQIFVQIPAYRDPDLSATLRDLFSKAYEPQSLRVAVLWQRASGDSIERELLEQPNLEIIGVPFEESKVWLGEKQASAVVAWRAIYFDLGFSPPIHVKLG
jgi:hypothetical protein